MNQSPHGTFNRYVNGPCRCEPCTAANREYLREYRARTNHWHSRLQGEAQRLALAMLKENVPDLYEDVMEEAVRNVGPRPGAQRKGRRTP